MDWQRSLYWRIATGVVGFLAAMLAVQALVYMWIIAESGRTLPGSSPTHFAQTIAEDVGAALERDASTDIAHYLTDQYSHTSHPFFIMLTDGRVISAGMDAPPTWVDATRAQLRRLRALNGARRTRLPRRPVDPDSAERQDPEAAALGFEPIPIVAYGQVIGMVVVAPRAPFSFVLRRFAPMLSLVATGVLIVGSILTSALIFGPPRRRLRSLEAAALRLGGGDIAARAPEEGGDEIAAVAAAFNRMAHDLTERAAALEQSDRMRRQLLADVSHELNTPITAMRGYLDTLRMSELEVDPERRERYLSIISDETTRLERLVGDLLDLARLESGGGAFTRAKVAVAELFARVSERHEHASQTAGVSIESEIQPGAETLVGDQARLEQALQNLAANAIRYAPRGSAVRLGAREEPDGSITLSVADEGPGITPDHIPYVFDRFYKVDQSRHEATTGSGLGLSIVKAIVERHGGQVALTSRPGRTVFEILGLRKADA